LFIIWIDLISSTLCGTSVLSFFSGDKQNTQYAIIFQPSHLPEHLLVHFGELKLHLLGHLHPSVWSHLVKSKSTSVWKKRKFEVTNVWMQSCSALELLYFVFFTWKYFIFISWNLKYLPELTKNVITFMDRYGMYHFDSSIVCWIIKKIMNIDGVLQCLTCAVLSAGEAFCFTKTRLVV